MRRLVGQDEIVLHELQGLAKEQIVVLKPTNSTGRVASSVQMFFRGSVLSAASGVDKSCPYTLGIIASTQYQPPR